MKFGEYVPSLVLGFPAKVLVGAYYLFMIVLLTTLIKFWRKYK